MYTYCFRVFEEAPISGRLQGLMLFRHLMPAETYTILADKGFTLVQEIMTPYRGHPTALSLDQRKFNRHLNSKRQVIFKHIYHHISLDWAIWENYDTYFGYLVSM